MPWRAVHRCSALSRASALSSTEPVDADDSAVADQLAVGVTALVDLTKAFYADLRDAEAGLLINVASMTGYAPMPEWPSTRRRRHS